MRLGRRVRHRHGAVYLGLAAAALTLQAAGPPLPQAWQAGLLVACVAVLGIPHGALDPFVARAGGVVRGRGDLARWLLAYGGLAGGTVLVWWAFPVLSLVLFLLASAVHFGSDWRGEVPAWGRAAGGAVVVLAPGLFHPAETARLFGMLVPEPAGVALVGALELPAIGAVLTLLLASAAVARRQPMAALELLSLPLLAWGLEPLPFFIVYFCILHSPRHLLEVFEQTALPAPRLIAGGVAVSAVTLVIAAMAYAGLTRLEVDAPVLKVVFVGLAALTVPHMVLMRQIHAMAPTRESRTDAKQDRAEPGV